MSNNRQNHAQVSMLKELQAVEFAAVELTLFLDTHPNDRQALADYNCLANRHHALVQQYEQQFGPLMVFGHSTSQYPWRWIDEPWPWEIEY